MIEKMRKNGIASALIAIALYSVFALIKDSPSMPNVLNIFKSAIGILTSRSFYLNFLYTIKIVFSGVLISFVIGFIIALSCCMSEFVNSLIMPIINSIKNVPSVALFPLFIVLFGIGDFPRILIIIWNSLYAIVASSMSGMDSVDGMVVEAADLDGADLFRRFIYIKIPLASVSILNGLKISVGSAFIAVVVAEMLGATKGIGYMILWDANAFKYPDMYVYILVIALIGCTINALIEKITLFAERKLYYG